MLGVKFSQLNDALIFLQFFMFLVSLLIVAFSGFMSFAWAFISRRIRNRFLAKTAYFFFFPVFSFLVVPLYFFQTYSLPKIFGLSTQGLGQWWFTFLVDNIIGFILVLPLIIFFYWMLEKFPRKWWLALGCLVAILFASAAFFPQLFLSEARKTEISSGALLSEISRFAPNQKIRLFKLIDDDKNKGFLISAYDVYAIDTAQEKRFYLGAGILDKFTHKEISSLLAHEAGHISPSSKAFKLLFTGLLILLSFYLINLLVNFSLKHFNSFLRIDKIQDPSSLSLVILAAFLSFGLLFQPISNVFSRYQEKQADLYALRITKDKEAEISALKKLHVLNGIEGDYGLLQKIFLEDHPSLQERIDYIKSFPLPKVICK